MVTQVPHGELAHVDFQPVPKGKENIGDFSVLEYGDILELAAVFQDTLIDEQTVDAVKPLLWIAAAALQNKSFLAVHSAKVIGGYGADAHITFGTVIISRSMRLSYRLFENTVISILLVK